MMMMMMMELRAAPIFRPLSAVAAPRTRPARL